MFDYTMGTITICMLIIINILITIIGIGGLFKILKVLKEIKSSMKHKNSSRLDS